MREYIEIDQAGQPSYREQATLESKTYIQAFRNDLRAKSEGAPRSEKRGQR